MLTLGVVGFVGTPFILFNGFPFADGTLVPGAVRSASSFFVHAFAFWALLSAATLFLRWEAAPLDSMGFLVFTVLAHCVTAATLLNIMGPVTAGGGIIAIVSILIGLAVLPRWLFWLALFTTLLTNTLIHYLNTTGALPLLPLFEQTLCAVGIEAELPRQTLATAVVYVPVILFGDRFIRRWKHDEGILQRHARMDGLTGAHSRRYALDALERLMKRRKDENHAALMVDIDHFKQINDEFGHAGGDRVLLDTTNAIRSMLRADDVVGRIGGEEFLILLPGAECSQALMVAERCRKAIAELTIPGSEGVRITASIGVAVFPEHGETRDELLAAADVALYRAKGTGRNRVERGSPRISASPQ